MVLSVVTKFESGAVYPNENIIIHFSDTFKELQHKHVEVKQVLLAGLHEMYDKWTPDYECHFSFLYTL